MKRLPNILVIVVTILNLAACSFPQSHSFLSRKVAIRELNQRDTLLTDHQTHKVLKQWSSLKYATDFPHQKITFVNKHPFAKSIYSITSGFSISSLCTQTKGIGLPVIVQTEKNKFSPVTNKAYQSNLHPGSLVVTKTSSGDLTILLLDPRDNHSYSGRPLKTQQHLIIDHITNDPSNRALDFLGLINPLKYEHLQGFYLSQPYDKNKIPVIMVHGIFSSPKTFMNLAERIELEPGLFKKYQIWHYYYPTGNPWLSTAHDFRKSFRRLLKKLDPQSNHSNLRKITIISHSMGGLITRLSLSEPKDYLSQAYLGKLGPKVLTKAQKERIHPFFNYKPLTEPKQVIFLAVPHRGSKMASGFIGWATNKFIAIPNILIKETVGALLPLHKSTLPKQTLKFLDKGENAVDQLKPNNPSLIALNQMKLPGHLKVHSLVGDIGLPLFRFYTDSVVSYRSAHLSKVGTETLIPSNHDITSDPKAIRRVLQILRN